MYDNILNTFYYSKKLIIIKIIKFHFKNLNLVKTNYRNGDSIPEI